MKRWLLYVPICVGLWSCHAYAEEDRFFGTERAAAVLNAPAVAVQVGKTATNLTQPGVEHLYDFGHEWRTGTSVALWTWRKDETPLLALRSGYITDFCPYVSVPLDLQGVTTRYVLPYLPDRLEGWLSAGALDTAWKAVGKYGMVGPWLGYNLDRQEDGNDDERTLVGGVSVGLRASF